MDRLLNGGTLTGSGLQPERVLPAASRNALGTLLQTQLESFPMKLQIVLAAASMLVAPAFMTAQAQSTGVYVSGGYTQFEGDGGANLGGITGRVGVNLYPEHRYRRRRLVRRQR